MPGSVPFLSDSVDWLSLLSLKQSAGEAVSSSVEAAVSTASAVTEAVTSTAETVTEAVTDAAEAM